MTNLLTIEQIVAAIDRVRSGEAKTSVARDIRVPESTFRGWLKNEAKFHELLGRSNPGKAEVPSANTYASARVVARKRSNSISSTSSTGSSSSQIDAPSTPLVDSTVRQWYMQTGYYPAWLFDQ